MSYYSDAHNKVWRTELKEKIKRLEKEGASTQRIAKLKEKLK